MVRIVSKQTNIYKEPQQQVVDIPKELSLSFLERKIYEYKNPPMEYYIPTSNERVFVSKEEGVKLLRKMFNIKEEGELFAIMGFQDLGDNMLYDKMNKCLVEKTIDHMLSNRYRRIKYLDIDGELYAGIDLPGEQFRCHIGNGKYTILPLMKVKGVDEKIHLVLPNPKWISDITHIQWASHVRNYRREHNDPELIAKKKKDLNKELANIINNMNRVRTELNNLNDLNKTILDNAEEGIEYLKSLDFVTKIKFENSNLYFTVGRREIKDTASRGMSEILMPPVEVTLDIMNGNIAYKGYHPHLLGRGGSDPCYGSVLANGIQESLMNYDVVATLSFIIEFLNHYNSYDCWNSDRDPRNILYDYFYNNGEEEIKNLSKEILTKYQSQLPYDLWTKFVKEDEKQLYTLDIYDEDEDDEDEDDEDDYDEYN